ncbi:MAG: ATP-binding protein, partial [Actinomycetota bacterium]
MDPGLDPYTPNAGARPPALVGRDDEIEAFDVLLARLQRGRAEQSLLVTGLRGVGKTVLLGVFQDRAHLAGWISVETEITRTTRFAGRMAHLTKRALLEIAPAKRWKERARRAARILQSFSLTVTTDGSVTGSLDLEPLAGRADSGDLGEDLTDLLVALGEAAAEHERGVVFLLDEIQFLDVPEFEALIAAIHKTVQRQLPITLVGAGLPQLPRLAGEAKSYAERLFRFPRIGRLDDAAAAAALVDPAREFGVEFDPRAVRTVLAYTEGYPYFVQEYGRVLWDHATRSPIGAIEAVEAQAVVEAKLDADFFGTRLERASDAEVVYMRALARLGSEPQRAGSVAHELGRPVERVATTRARLIDKGLVYAPKRGLTAFTVPQFDRY